MVGVIGREDYTAQGLYQKLRSLKAQVTEPLSGAISFYGLNVDNIHHVAFCVDPFTCYEAGGGGKTTKTQWLAKEIGACVRLTATKKRSDYLLSLRPRYLLLGET